ncbi:MAG: hypothetical protein ACLTE4_11000, partial [Christensenellaceae bacterium]
CDPPCGHAETYHGEGAKVQRCREERTVRVRRGSEKKESCRLGKGEGKKKHADTKRFGKE